MLFRSKEDQEFAKEYLDHKTIKHLHWAMIRAAISSTADTAIIPIQDYLGLGSEARINIPSTLGINWKWRMDKNALTAELAEQIRRMARMYGRL